MDPTKAARDGNPAAVVELEVLGIAWERIQLVLRVRVTGGRLPADHGFRLERLGRHAPVMPVTRASADGDAWTLRFNVMSGPDLDPLAAGRWTLTVGPDPDASADPDTLADPGRPVRITSPAGSVESVGPRVYDTDRDEAPVTLAFTPSVDPVGSRLVVTVSVAPRSDAEGGPPSKGRRSGWLRDVRAALFAGAFATLARLLPHDGRRILFTSDSHAELTGNLALVHDRMIERGLDRDRTFTTMLRPHRRSRRGRLDRLRITWALLRADVVVIDDFQPIIYRLRFPPDVRVVQLWHASGAFKTVGYSRVGKDGGPGAWSRAHKNYTHAIVSSETDVPYYAEAFGIREARVVPTGIPRMDRYFDEASRTAGRAAAYRAYPMAEGRRTILLAPTFRGDGATTAHYDMSWLDHAALHALAVDLDAVILIRMHPFVREPLGIPEAYRDRLIDGSGSDVDVNDLLFIVDLLITDYSSIIFEFSTFRRPMLFYAPDLEEYIASRDFYEPFESFVPGRIVRDHAALIEAIRTDDLEAGKVDAFAARHFAHLDGHSTDRVIDDVILGGSDAPAGSAGSTGPAGSSAS